MNRSMSKAIRKVAAIVAALGLLIPSAGIAQATPGKTWKVKDSKQRLRLADGSLLVLEKNSVAQSIPFSAIARVGCEKHTEQPIPQRMEDSVNTIMEAGQRAAERSGDPRAGGVVLTGASAYAAVQTIVLLPFWFWKSSRHVIRIGLWEKARNGRNRVRSFRLSGKDAREVCSQLGAALRKTYPGQVETVTRKGRVEYYWYQAVEDRVRLAATPRRQAEPVRVIDLSHMTRDELFRVAPAPQAKADEPCPLRLPPQAALPRRAEERCGINRQAVSFLAWQIYSGRVVPEARDGLRRLY